MSVSVCAEKITRQADVLISDWNVCVVAFCFVLAHRFKRYDFLVLLHFVSRKFLVPANQSSALRRNIYFVFHFPLTLNNDETVLGD